MLVSAVMFSQVVTAIHVIAVVGAFGFVFAYPFVSIGTGRIDPRLLPAVHRTRQQIGRLLVNPALLLVFVSGIYLASDLHEWKQFFVQWGVAVVVVIGGLEGAVVMRQEGKLADLAETEAGAGGGSLSAAYVRARNLSRGASWLVTVLVIITIYLMVIRAS